MGGKVLGASRVVAVVVEPQQLRDHRGLVADAKPSSVVAQEVAARTRGSSGRGR